jgi:hypothetical protein
MKTPPKAKRNGNKNQRTRAKPKGSAVTRTRLQQITRRIVENFHPQKIILFGCTPKELEKRIALGDWFLREIVARGRVLYERTHA